MPLSHLLFCFFKAFSPIAFNPNNGQMYNTPNVFPQFPAVQTRPSSTGSKPQQPVPPISFLQVKVRSSLCARAWILTDISPLINCFVHQGEVFLFCFTDYHRVCQVSGVRCQVSGVRCQASGVRCQVSGVRCQVSGVRCQVSGVRC